MNPVVWFEIPVEDLERAKSFYESVFNFEMPVSEMGPAHMAWFPGGPGEGASGALFKTDGYVPSHHGSIVYFHAPDIESSLKTIEENGGKTLVPKMSIGEYGWFAQFEDSEGNRVSLHTPAE